MNAQPATFVALCREFAEEVRNLQSEALRLSDALNDANANHARAVSRWTDVSSENLPQTAARLESMITSSQADAQVREAYGDAVVRIENMWKRIEHSGSLLAASVAAGAASSETPGSLAALRDGLGEVAQECAFVTIPSRLNQNLSSLRTGETLDFHQEFADEVQDEEHRQKVFDWFASHSRPFSGVFDTERSLVIKASPNRARRYVSVAGLSVLAVAVALLPALRHPLGLEDTFLADENNDSALVTAVLWAYVGAFVHVVLDVWKDVQRSRQTGRGAPSVSSWVLWIHVREVSIAFSILIVGAAAIAAAEMTKGTDVVTMIAVGYSADSIFDLLQPKAVSLLTKRADTVKTLVKT